MQRPLLTRLKQLLLLPALVALISQMSVTEVYSQIFQSASATCDCDASLPPGYRIMNFSITGDPGTDWVLYMANDIYDPMDLTSFLPDNTAIPEVSAGLYMVTIIVDASGSPAAKYGYDDGSMIVFEDDLAFPVSCDIHQVSLTASETEFCSNGTGVTNFFAENSQNIEFYSYEWFLDGVSQGAGSGFGANGSTFSLPQSMAPNTYTISVVGTKLDFAGMPTGCMVMNELIIMVTNFSDNVTITGDTFFCDDGSGPKDYFLAPDVFGGQTIEWILKDEDGDPTGLPMGGPFTGSGTSIDFAGLATGLYTLCGSGTSSDGCFFQSSLEIELYEPTVDLLGECDILCSQEETYTISVTGGIEPGTVVWTANGGTIVSMTDTEVVVEWDDSTVLPFPSVSVSGDNTDGCPFSLEKPIQFLNADAYFFIDGDTYVCDSSDDAVYKLMNSSGQPLDYNYTWTLLDPNGDVVALLASTNGGLCQPIDWTGADPGVYTLEIVGTATGGCPDFMTSLPITVDDPTDIPTMACVSSGLNVTIGNNCELVVTADLLLEGSGTVNNDQFIIMLANAANGEAIDGNVLDHSHIGLTIEVKVIDECSGNSCWGYITIEDKSVPVPICPIIIGNRTCEEVADKANPDFMPIFAADVTVTMTGDNTWTLDGFDNCGLATLTCEDFNVGEECDNPSTIHRVWTITDEYGATSSCITSINVEYDEDNLVVMPPNYDDIIPGAEPSIDVCSDYPLDDNGNPHPSFTGYPTGAACANVVVAGYTDVNLELCGPGSPARKIIREWSIWNSCTNQDDIYTQFITLTDKAPPICANFNEFAVSTGEHECSQTIFVPYPEVAGECGDIFLELSYKLRDEFGIIPALFSTDGVSESVADGGFYIDEVEFLSDSLWVLFEVKDACGNGTTECLTEVALLDQTPPTPICDLNNNVALNADGCAYAGPKTFDDHSYDNCQVYQTVVKRLDEGANCGGCEKPHFDFLTYLGEFGGSHYYLSQEPTTGPKAFAYSNAIESHVATVETAAEGTWIHDQVATYTNEDYFLGYRATGVTNADSPDESDFDTQAGGVMAYENWAGGEPDWNLYGTGDLYVSVQSDGSWIAERESIVNDYYVVEVEDPCIFNQKVKFCCADIGQETMVIMRVFDAHGNFADCMVNVNVQDFKDPIFTSTPNTPIDQDCEQLDGTDYLLGVASDDLNTLFGVPTWTDNCTPTVVYTVDITDATQCGSYTITRKWVVSDQSGNSVSHTQIINVGNNTPFGESNIIWPQDYDQYDCNGGNDPEDLPVANGYPRYNGVDACTGATSSHDDQVFNYSELACVKILRTWSVIDWCQPDQTWTHVQVIKVFDSEGPVVTFGCQDLPQVDGEVNNACQLITNDGGLVLKATDDCDISEPTIWYDLDINNDGTTEFVGVQSDDANGTYPFGTHKLTWYAEDKCGNLTTCSMLFTINADTDNPTAYCLTEIVTVLPLSGEVTIWASDFDAGSFVGDCGDSGDLTFSFSSNTSNTNATFTCDDIQNEDKDTIPLQMWVTDEFGNQSFCNAFLILQDNHDQCGEGTTDDMARIQGRVYTENDDMLDDVAMSLMNGGDDAMMTYMTYEGEYVFEDVAMHNNYDVLAKKDDDHLNGVSTLDLVLIQKHILGTQDLDSPYKIIAADANNSESVSAIDLVEIRKLILGVYDELPKNDSYRFVMEDYIFPDPQDPFPFEEDININELESNLLNQDFIAVKIGDVNNSMIISAQSGDQVEDRSLQLLDLKTSQRDLEDDRVAIDVIAKQALTIAGAQMSLTLEGANFLDIEAAAWNVGKAHFAYLNNELRISYNEAKGATSAIDDVLFSIIVESGSASDIEVALTETINREAYVSQAGEIDTWKIAIESEDFVETSFALFQNSPNPFADETVIAFTLQNEDEVQFQVFDNSGRVLFETNGTYGRGYHEILLEQSDLETTGILYYQLSTDTHIETRKMIVLK